jgi:hypothetical protein
MPSIRAPAAKKATTLTVSLFRLYQSETVTFCLIVSTNFLKQVAVKCRPFKEIERSRDIVRVIDNKVCSGLKFC